MIEYLEQLVEERKFREAISQAELLLGKANIDTHESAVAFSTILTARLMLHEYEAAVAVGPVAIDLCEQSGTWDYFGRACLDLGTAYYCLDALEQALGSWYHFLDHLHTYSRALRYEGRIWFNISKVSEGRGDYENATKALERAVDAAKRHSSMREAHGYRHSMIETCIKGGKLHQVPRLLAKSLHYLRHHPELASLLWHFKLRADFALSTGRVHRALFVAIRGLALAEGRQIHEYFFHAQLGDIMGRLGLREMSLGHYLAARHWALACRRADLAAVVDEPVRRIVQSDTAALERLDTTLFSSIKGSC